jgi:hypothetical protein
VDPSGGCDRAFARGGNVSSMGDNSDIDCASCVGSAADKKATAASNAAWRTYSSSTQSSAIRMIQNTYLDALLILQSSLKHPQYRINLQIHHQIRTPSEDPIRAFPLARTVHTPFCTLGMRHAECLRLESVPWSPAHHSLIREVRDGVDTLPSDIGRGLVREREEQ